VLDVGAGTGAITAPLLRAGLRVIAVEEHPGRAATLRRRFGHDIVVVQADAADLRLPRQPFHVVSNPPYGVTTALLRGLLHRGSRLESAHLVLQRQAAARWSGAGAPGAGRWSAHYAAVLGSPVPRSAFTPPPPVDSRILVLQRR
jgi:23S rRNA (adenine-N6)-dimethyltransferase